MRVNTQTGTRALKVVTYHHEVSLWVLRRSFGGENTGALEVLGQWRAKVGIFKRAQVLRLGRVGGTDLIGLHGEISLTQATTRKQFLI